MHAMTCSGNGEPLPKSHPLGGEFVNALFLGGLRRSTNHWHAHRLKIP